VERIVVRVYDPENIDTHEKCVDFVTTQFPFYTVEAVMRGYRE